MEEGTEFDLAALQARVDRHKRKARSKSVAGEVHRPPSEAELSDLQAGRSSPPLESYDLAKLGPVPLMVAALLEAGHDLTPAEMGQRLQRTLPERQAFPIRETLAGKLTLVRQGREFRTVLSELTHNLWRKYRPTEAVREVRLADPGERAKQLRRRWSEGRRALVHGRLALEPDGRVRQLTDPWEYLRSLELVIGLNPWSYYESLDIPLDGRLIVDLSVTRWPLPDLVDLAGGQPWRGDGREHDLHCLEQVRRYGVLHGQIGGHDVSWNPGLEPTLWSAVDASLQQGKPLRLTLRGRGSGDFVPHDITGCEVVGLWKGRATAILREDVLGLEVPAGLEVPPGVKDFFAFA